MSAEFWGKNQRVMIKPTPGSGSMIGLPGDLLVLGECVLKDFVVDVKAERGLLNKKVKDYYRKNEEDAERKPSFLEIYDFDNNNMDPEKFIVIRRKYFARIMEELNGYRKGSE